MQYEENQQDYKAYFSAADKAKAFDVIAALYYDKNFGSASKADIDLLMFRFYMEAVIRANKIGNSDVIQYAACSDYKMSQKLGITQQRIRNLKVKKELVYPQEDFHWEQSLSSLLQDENRMKMENGLVRISIPDPNLFYAIEDFVEDCGGYVELHRNRKILEIRQEYLLQLAILLEQQEGQLKILAYVNEEIKRENRQKKVNKACTIVKTILEQSVNAVEIFSGVVNMLSPENPFGSFLRQL